MDPLVDDLALNRFTDVFLAPSVANGGLVSMGWVGG